MAKEKSLSERLQDAIKRLQKKSPAKAKKPKIVEKQLKDVMQTPSEAPKPKKEKKEEKKAEIIKKVQAKLNKPQT